MFIFLQKHLGTDARAHIIFCKLISINTLTTMQHTDAADTRLLIRAHIEICCESKPSGQDRQTNSAQIWELLDFIWVFFFKFLLQRRCGSLLEENIIKHIFTHFIKWSPSKGCISYQILFNCSHILHYTEVCTRDIKIDINMLIPTSI